MAVVEDMILITGHPRSGTHFTAKVLRRLGYPTSCEGRNLRPGKTWFVSSWKHAQPGTFHFRLGSRPIHTGFKRVLHQVRHPLSVISSSTTLSHLTTDHIRKYVDLPEPSIRRNQPVKLCMRSWLEWNRMIEDQADWRFQLEELQELFPALCRQLSIPPRQLPRMGKGSRNARKHSHWSWDDLDRQCPVLTREIKEQAQRYGYAD
ncbi:hypothetical protein H0Z60_09140 [Ectothiorhodospiraceae bacterium WFHF3C12]|nr:hypothetical protein [Ectothiorhodospiraceae bacterium WFHF3C12]